MSKDNWGWISGYTQVGDFQTRIDAEKAAREVCEPGEMFSVGTIRYTDAAELMPGPEDIIKMFRDNVINTRDFPVPGEAFRTHDISLEAKMELNRHLRDWGRQYIGRSKTWELDPSSIEYFLTPRA